jgi:hypothetical protein
MSSAKIKAEASAYVQMYTELGFASVFKDDLDDMFGDDADFQDEMPQQDETAQYYLSMIEEVKLLMPETKIIYTLK